MNTIRILLSFTTHFGWDMQHFDMKNTFFSHEDIKEVYMEIPLGFDGNNKLHRGASSKSIIWIKTIPSCLVWTIH